MRDIMDKNDNGELIRIDHTNTYEGIATMPDGHVVRKKFRCCNKSEAVEQWRKWQACCLENDRERQKKKMQQSKKENLVTKEEVKLSDATILLPMLSKINNAMDRIAEALELIAVSDNQPVIVKEVVNKTSSQPAKKKASDGISEFFLHHDPYEFINCTGSDIRKKIAPYCRSNGYLEPTAQQITMYMKNNFADKLTWKTDNNGTMFFFKTK